MEPLLPPTHSPVPTACINPTPFYPRVSRWPLSLLLPQISCAWGFTTSGGAKGVGESTTSAVVISLVMIFIADFVMSFIFFQGQGTALKQLK